MQKNSIPENSFSTKRPPIIVKYKPWQEILHPTPIFGSLQTSGLRINLPG